jgi:hypothetical protein
MVNLQLVLTFLFSLVDALKSPLANGNKFSFRDLFSFGPVLKQFPPPASFKAALQELDGLDDAKRGELMAFIREKFKLDNKQVEEKIEAGLSLALKLYGIAPEVKQLIAKLPSVPSVAKVETVNVQAENVNVVPQ